MENLKQWERASASQIKTYRECKRKWWWEKIAGKESPGSPSTELGSKIHDYIERVLKEEEERNDVGFPQELVTHAWDYLENYMPTPSANVEKEFMEYRVFKAPMKGMIDLLVVEEKGDRLEVEIIDHKSTKSANFKWAKTAEQLQLDAQAQIYSAVVRKELQEIYEDKEIDLKFTHNYICTTRIKQPLIVSTPMPHEVIDKGVADVNDTLASMKKDAKETEPKNVLPSWTSCGNYGGCPHAADCQALEDFDVYQALWPELEQEGDNMSLDWLNEAKTQKAEKEKPKASSSTGPIICVGCRPRSGDYVTLEEWTAKEQKEWSEGAKLPHYMADPYNKGPRSVCVLVDHKVRNGNKELPTVLVVDPRTALGGTWLGFLDEEIYGCVIDGRF